MIFSTSHQAYENNDYVFKSASMGGQKEGHCEWKRKGKKERKVQQDGGQLLLDNSHALTNHLQLTLLLVKEYGTANNEQCSPKQLRTQ